MLRTQFAGSTEASLMKSEIYVDAGAVEHMKQAEHVIAVVASPHKIEAERGAHSGPPEVSYSVI